MSKRIRNWLFISFVWLFVIGTITISLYASGFKLNPSWPPQLNRLLIKTGMIILESRPGEAVVFVDGQPQTFFSLNPWHDEYITTDTKIRNVPPGEHTVRLEKSGYWPWEKKIMVYPNQATTLLDVYLFRSSPPELLFESGPTELSLNNTNRYLYVTKERKIVSTKKGEDYELPAGQEKAGYWLKDSNYLLYDSQLISPGSLANKDFRPLLGEGTINHFDESSNRLYYQKNDDIGFLELSSQSASLVLSTANILAYRPHGNTIWLVSADNGRALLQSFTFPDGPLRSRLELPGIGSYIFKEDGGPLLSLYDEQNKTLYLINPESPESGPTTIKDILSWQWIDNENLLYNNNWEIFRLNLSSSANSLLTRVGEEIGAIIWDKKFEYLIFSTADSLQIFNPRLETTTRLLQAKKLSAPILNTDENSLYFWADTGQQAGVWRYLLQ